VIDFIASLIAAVVDLIVDLPGRLATGDPPLVVAVLAVLVVVVAVVAGAIAKAGWPFVAVTRRDDTL
jgi:hypothetical protein